jgi:hypothetical protein
MLLVVAFDGASTVLVDPRCRGLADTRIDDGAVESLGATDCHVIRLSVEGKVRDPGRPL